jgi:hypothetical protein
LWTKIQVECVSLINLLVSLGVEKASREFFLKCKWYLSSSTIALDLTNEIFEIIQCGRKNKTP